jgi:hypothetical protein
VATLERKKEPQTFGLGITLERRLAERSSSIVSENPVPTHHRIKIFEQMNIIRLRDSKACNQQ